MRADVVTMWTSVSSTLKRTRPVAVVGRPDEDGPPESALGELLGKIAVGDKDAFAKTYDRTAGPLLRVLMERVGNPALAGSLVEETFLNVWREAPCFQRRENAEQWLLRRVPATSRPGSPADEEPSDSF